MARKLNGIELTRYDDLFKTDAERETDHQERVQIVPAEQVFPYARQPYSVDRPSADLVRLMDSIERTGIAEPLIVRPRSEGGYEIISGHRRDYCAKVVGLDTRPVIVRNYSDEDADILVVDYNINRENLLPSEKAKAYIITLKTALMISWTILRWKKRRQRRRAMWPVRWKRTVLPMMVPLFMPPIRTCAFAFTGTIQTKRRRHRPQSMRWSTIERQSFQRFWILTS